MFNIFEQTVVFFGEPKLGLWRIQENGFIREYRRYAKNGLRETADPNDPNLPWSDFEVIKNNYASYMHQDNTLYKYPDDKTWNGYFQYLDLSIYHPKYEGKYDNHVPIDLPHFYVTISQVAGQRKWRFFVHFFLNGVYDRWNNIPHYTQTEKIWKRALWALTD